MFRVELYMGTSTLADTETQDLRPTFKNIN